MSKSDRKPINIRFRYNKESGEIEELIVDDNSPNASESFHDQIADAIAQQLGANPVIFDADTGEERPATGTVSNDQTTPQRDLELE